MFGPPTPVGPTLHVAGWSSGRTPGHWGPAGPRLSIMLQTPGWAPCDGIMAALRANTRHEVADLGVVLHARRVGWTDADAAALRRYRGSMEARWQALLDAGKLAPGALSYQPVVVVDGVVDRPVPSGATLCCACGVNDSDAGRCHRNWVSAYLRLAGWQVVLDGYPVP